MVRCFFTCILVLNQTQARVVYPKRKYVVSASTFFYLGGEDAVGVSLSALFAARLSLQHYALHPLIVAEVARGPGAACPCAWLVQVQKFVLAGRGGRLIWLSSKQCFGWLCEHFVAAPRAEPKLRGGQRLQQVAGMRGSRQMIENAHLCSG